jgi:hypothetical protein
MSTKRKVGKSPVLGAPYGQDPYEKLAASMAGNKLRRDYAYEILDRAHCLSWSFDSLITEHPGSAINRKIYDAVCKASDALGDLYQVIGKEVL